MCFLKGALGVKITTPNWALLQECGQKPLQFCWFHAAAKFFNSLLCGNCGLLKKIVHEDFQVDLSASYKKCWTADFKEACEGLHASDRYTCCGKAAIPLPLQDSWSI